MDAFLNVFLAERRLLGDNPVFLICLEIRGRNNIKYSF
ncbi:hypothetical protein MuYL_1269 [Mucilaginibacter xinganensis]|uniref:Uncharacterized protein n=1 Tax=Mucilaginibacter xinganensis TaxID=1234841 RepID=A0A223NTI6_9SPHI|nr:hypothetical protein MuYL_1269 [Mucilaginibacter xinganensis]